jgi:hypothetical protein
LIGSKETESRRESSSVSESGGVLRQAMSRWRKQDGSSEPETSESLRKSKMGEKSSDSTEPGLDCQMSTTSTTAPTRDLQEILLSPAGTVQKCSNLLSLKVQSHQKLNFILESINKNQHFCKTVSFTFLNLYILF